MRISVYCTSSCSPTHQNQPGHHVAVSCLLQRIPSSFDPERFWFYVFPIEVRFHVLIQIRKYPSPSLAVDVQGRVKINSRCLSQLKPRSESVLAQEVIHMSYGPAPLGTLNILHHNLKQKRTVRWFRFDITRQCWVGC